LSSLRALRKMDIDPAWLLRIFTIIPVALIVLAGIGALWIYFFVMSLLPESQSRIDLPGLKAEVSVVRDGKGIPGIIGANEADVATVLGYVMAQDRLWQMDFLRRASQGRLAEILGREYLDSDQLMRIASAGRQNQESADKLNEPQRVWIESFVRGINLYLARHSGKLPVEFSLLEYRPEPFSVDDVLGIFLALAKESSPAFRVDPVMVRILGRVGPKRAFALFPADPAASRKLVISDLRGWQPDGLIFRVAASSPGLARVPGFRGGCLWALGREKTRSGNSMAGCMVYQALSAPGFWYRARLVAGDFHLAGAFVPGVPVALVGSNRYVAWGAISTPADDADLFVERLDSDSPKHYWRVDRWRPLREITETYRIRNGRSIQRTVKLTETGPLVSQVTNGKGLSLRWTARDGLGLVPAFYSVNRARSGDGIVTALQSLVAPVLYVVWADSDGGHGMQMAGRVPVRSSGSDGIIPMPGWTAVHDWKGFIPFAELPSVSGGGPLVVSDGRPGGPDYPYFVSCYWNDDSRKNRISKLLAGAGEQSPQTFQHVLSDTKSPLARDLVPVLLKAAGAWKSLNPAQEKAIEILRSWDLSMPRDSAGAAVFALTYQSLVDELFRKSLGEDCFPGFSRENRLVAATIKRIFLGGRTDWLGKTGPGKVLLRSFQKAIDQGTSMMGSNLSKWKWGDVHKAVFRHPLTARSRFLELLYHVGPVSLAGSDDTIDLAGWFPSHPFLVRNGVSLRQISDMTHPPELVGITPMGASAHFFSTHYKDQMSAWAQGRYVRDPIVKADIRQTGMSGVLFRPGTHGRISRR
jgi:penicillin amidase